MAKNVNFLFVCPDAGKVFESRAFSILENRGVVVDEGGSKILDAKVALDEPCPFCGRKHVYHASELLCPYRESMTGK
ncbi:MAG: hypothetical protein RBR09_02265 [Desulfobulbaceae bacterium]|jgi:predicted RNA-binding Zn-ribbon protein involved in translation (DUF1610 family)|nr:hypothetical protein [Desulfobulbaceae bacterium]MDY0350053.1 hypothetical protein [Desulfobulbaceae bacterium]